MTDLAKAKGIGKGKGKGCNWSTCAAFVSYRIDFYVGEYSLAEDRIRVSPMTTGRFYGDINPASRSWPARQHVGTSARIMLDFSNPPEYCPRALRQVV